MDKVPLEYLWHYNPVTGRVAGAQQNYGQRINILHANRYLFDRMKDVQRKRNEIVTAQGLKSLKGGSYMHYIPTGSVHFEDNGDLEGGSDIQNNLEELVLAAEEAKDKTEGRLTARRFISAFPPVVYNNPFDGPDFPVEFNPLYSPEGNEFTSELTGGWVAFSQDPFRGGWTAISEQHPKLNGGAVSVRGSFPQLG